MPYFVPGRSDCPKLSLPSLGALGSPTQSDNNFHAFLYREGSMTDLGTFGGLRSYANAINNTGQVAGYSYPGSGPSRAFLYSGATTTDLNSLIDPSSGWALRQAWAISNRGQIAGFGMNPSGQIHALLLTPFRVLFVRPSGTDLAISWFTNAPTPFLLVQTTGLPSPNWVAVTNVPVVTIDQCRVLISPLQSGNRFYRLQSQ